MTTRHTISPFFLALILLSACDLRQEQPVVQLDGRPCPTQSRSMLASPSQVGDPATLVAAFNQHSSVSVEFESNDQDLPSTLRVSDSLQLTLADGWTAEDVVYPSPPGPVCPEAGSRIEVHGLLEVTSAEGLNYAIPALLSSPSEDPSEAALVLWSAALDDGRDALPNPLIPLPSVYADGATGLPNDGPSPDLLGLYLGTDHELGGSLGAGVVMSLSTYSADESRVSSFLVGSFVW